MILNAANIQSMFLGFSAAFKQGLDGAPSRWAQIAMEVPSATKAETYAWLKSIPRMREWIGERVVNNLSVTGYTIVNRLFESTIKVARTDIEDDQFGVYSPLI